MQYKLELKKHIKLSDYVDSIVLAQQQTIKFKPGQYLKVILNSNDKRFFSIASQVDENSIELQIGTNNNYSNDVINFAKTNGYLDIEMPFGNAYLRNHSKNVLLLAGGSGFSYAKAILESDQIKNKKVDLIWAMKSENLFYNLNFLKQVKDKNSNFNYHLCAENTNTSNVFKGMLHNKLASFSNINEYDIYIAGPYQMCIFLNKLLQEMQFKNHIYSDSITKT